MSGPAPDLDVERRLLDAGAPLVAGMDEVGRGALAGPVAVGVAVVSAATGAVPEGLRDSKLLPAPAREALEPVVQEWAVAWAVGLAEAAEVDAHGIITALRLAGRRALAQIGATGVVAPVVLLDGSHDWLTLPDPGLFGDEDAAAAVVLPREPRVTTRVKADQSCAAVAAASIVAKVARDRLMARLHDDCPAYGWAVNKGYAAPAHVEALQRLGASAEHRRSWRLPGVDVRA